MQIVIDTTTLTGTELVNLVNLFEGLQYERGLKPLVVPTGTVLTAGAALSNGALAGLNSAVSSMMGGTASIPPPPPAADVSLLPPANLFTNSEPAALTADAAPPSPDSAPIPDGARDKNGFLWDERIHSESKAFNKDGSWRFRRNLDPQVRDTIIAQILNGAAAAVMTSPAVPIHVPAPVQNVPPPPVDTTLNAMPPVRVAAAVVPPPPPAGDAPTFKSLMTVITGAMQSGKLKNEQVMEACREAQIAGLQVLIKDSSKVASVLAAVNRMIAA